MKFLSCKVDEITNMIIDLFEVCIADLHVQCCAEHRQVYLSRTVPIHGGAHGPVETRQKQGNNQRRPGWKALFKQVQANMAEPSNQDAEEVQIGEDDLSTIIAPARVVLLSCLSGSLQHEITYLWISNLAPSNPFAILR